MNQKHHQNKALARWKYIPKEWNDFVRFEKANKKEDNLYYGITILLITPFVLMLLRTTSYLTGLLFAIPFTILMPYLRIKFSYKYLKKGVENPEVLIFLYYLFINNHKITLNNTYKRIKSIKIIDGKNNTKLLGFDVQWLTGKGPTNNEFRVLIPNNNILETQNLVKYYK